MHDDRLESDELEQCDVLDHTLFQILIHHGAAAVFHHDDLAVKALDVRQSLDQHLRFVQILLHVLVHNYLLRGRSKIQFHYVPD